MEGKRKILSRVRPWWRQNWKCVEDTCKLSNTNGKCESLVGWNGREIKSQDTQCLLLSKSLSHHKNLAIMEFNLFKTVLGMVVQARTWVGMAFRTYFSKLLHPYSKEVSHTSLLICSETSEQYLQSNYI